mmetsp:Transcript_49860/g.97558  ORF Transcript_49860/g.97558 Transcript_49860/m.97558 type:complete len:324 (+) Transcript_49860:58-1029(+)
MLNLRHSLFLLLLSLFVAASISGSIERSGNIVSIDYDVPRRGPLCVSVDETDSLKFVWEEWHNLHVMPDEDAYAECDFVEATMLAEASPNPTGYVVTTNSASSMFFSCSKICSSNGHKVRVCVGGFRDDENGCSVAKECTPDRMYDLRRRIKETESGGSSILPRRYNQSGAVCRPKNGDGYRIWSGIDTPKSCEEKCEADASKCGAWEFENHNGDNRECELHEKSVISVEETKAMGKCQITEDDVLGYKCCWILQEIIDALEVANDEVLNDVAKNTTGTLDQVEVTNDEIVKNLATNTSGSDSAFTHKTMFFIPLLILTLHVI